ncbi:MAG: hypothetical protein R3321_00375 [Nitrososphaeraceae archaeon]|nr:hypothetical protein [Nitrososphaeraceae archaeon]
MTIFHKRLAILRVVVKSQNGTRRMETQREINMLEAKMNMTKNRVFDVVSHDDNQSYTRAVYRNTKANNIRPLVK